MPALSAAWYRRSQRDRVHAVRSLVLLLASLLVEPHTDRVVGLNVYPGVIPFMGDFGAWVNLDDQSRVSFGITHRQAMGLGLGVGF